MVESVANGRVDSLLAKHRLVHDHMVSLQCVNVILVGRKDSGGLAPLAEAVFGNGGDDLLAVLLLGVDPAGHLVEVLGEVVGLRSELNDLKHGLANGGSGLLDFSDNGRIVKDSARDLAVAATEAEHEVEGRLLLDVIVGKCPAVLELLAGKDKTLLIGRDSLLVLDLLLNVVDGVRRLNIEGDGLPGESLYEDLGEAGL